MAFGVLCFDVDVLQYVALTPADDAACHSVGECCERLLNDVKLAIGCLYFCVSVRGIFCQGLDHSGRFCHL